MTMQAPTQTQPAPRKAERAEQRPTLTPAVDIFENKDELLLLADLPGVSPGDLSLNFDKGELSIRGARGAFDYHRSFVLPKGIDAEHISARLDAGVLEIRLPKPAAQRPRQIPVKLA